jgi:hypothetical protein
MKTLWLKNPEKHDFPTAVDYLELLFPPLKARSIKNKLKNVKTIQKKAKDILRASEMQLLPKNNIHVKENIKKSKDGIKLSPILLVRNEKKLIIADGYHRLCSIYYISEDFKVPCRIV